MTKRITTLIIAIVCCATSFAQKVEVRRLEGEIGVGLVNGASKLSLDGCDAGPLLYAELRYNLRALPIDVGVQLSSSYFHREADGQADRLQTKSGNIMAVADYNLFRGRKISIFAGAGVGCGVLNLTAPISITRPDEQWSGYSTGEGKAKISIMPRFGVELFNHLRLTLFYVGEERANIHFGLSIGGVLGGGRKR